MTTNKGAMNLDDIKASADTVMTKELIRMFASAGCKPTVCHACLTEIKVGDIFKLVPHRILKWEPKDEMCCSKCNDDSLTKRDRRELRYSIRANGSGGYSRPSKVAK